jgi:hypothetical protein
MTKTSLSFSSFGKENALQFAREDLDYKLPISCLPQVWLLSEFFHVYNLLVGILILYLAASRVYHVFLGFHFFLGIFSLSHDLCVLLEIL